MKLVKAKHTDANACMEMIKAFYQLDNYPFSEEKAMKCFNEILANDQLGKFWLIHQDDKIIGYLIFCYGYSFEYGGRDAFIDEFYLKEEARGKGIGTEVLLELEKEASKLGVKAIHLEVEKTNVAGNKLYSKVGFKGNNRSLLTQIID